MSRQHSKYWNGGDFCFGLTVDYGQNVFVVTVLRTRGVMAGCATTTATGSSRPAWCGFRSHFDPQPTWTIPIGSSEVLRGYSLYSLHPWARRCVIWRLFWIFLWIWKLFLCKLFPLCQHLPESCRCECFCRAFSRPSIWSSQFGRRSKCQVNSN